MLVVNNSLKKPELTREVIKKAVIDFIFDWENTTDGANFDKLYLGLCDLFNCEAFIGSNLWAMSTWFDRSEQDVAITYYCEKIGGFDIIIDYIFNYSIDWITDSILKALEKIKNI